MTFWTLHIGTRKTGSKALQRFLRDRAAADPAGLCYPASGRGALWHQPVHMALCDGDDGPLSQAVRAADPARHARAVLSCELFHTLPRPAVACLRRHLGTARIVIFLRRQDAAINSLLNQYAKAHRISHAQVVEFRAAALSALPEFDYAAILRDWEDVFGPGSVVPVIYDKTVDVVAAFCAATGLEPPREAAPAGNPNPALSRAGYAAFLSAKRAVRDLDELPGVVEDLRRRLGHELLDTRQVEPPWLFEPAERAAIMAQYSDGNERVRAQWFPARRALFDGG
ncbi:hypothetical protein [Rhodobaculum claviforme]|uniref:Uncharacterized protein n=1 Tax=Rhodobaculum claviforme TaxID=1549854 RepID=A0A934WJG0_9RHOB|nr:hypothetical protein [Rhodobaculum claviforme]MBK5928006.1 hypothetical protein [Rhodobaculum claviforme]